MKYLNSFKLVILSVLFTLFMISCGKADKQGPGGRNVFSGSWYGLSGETLNVSFTDTPAPYSDYNQLVSYQVGGATSTEHCQYIDADHLLCAYTNTTLSYDESTQLVTLRGSLVSTTTFSRTQPEDFSSYFLHTFQSTNCTTSCTQMTITKDNGYFTVSMNDNNGSFSIESYTLSFTRVDQSTVRATGKSLSGNNDFDATYNSESQLLTEVVGPWCSSGQCTYRPIQ